MANGYFERGEIYLINVGVSFVPSLIVSSDENNRSTGRVIVATMSEYGDGSNYAVKTFATGRESHINCDMVSCVLKKSIGRYLGTAPKEIMDQVDTALENIFELGYVDDDKEAEIERLRLEVTRLEAQVAYKEESIIARGKEIANMNAKYNKAVDRIVELELDRDIATRIAERKAAVEAPVEEEEEELVEETAAEDPPIEEAPVEEKKEFVRQLVNVNTASAKEISEKLGMSLSLVYGITAYRKKNGPFVEVEELKEVRTITNPIFERIKDYIVIEEETEEETEDIEESEDLTPEDPVEEPVVKAKVNVNTASCYELTKVGFTPQQAAHIRHNTKMCGPFKSIDDLANVDTIKAKDLRKLRDKLEV